MEYVFTPPPHISLAVVGTRKRFPVRRIYCIGRNYDDHIAEMNSDINRSEPVFFTKAAETLVETGADIPFPPNTQNLQHEVELVIAIGPSPRNNSIFGYGVGIDLTRRDLQAHAKINGSPWARAKNFSLSAPCSPITLARNVDLRHAHIVLRKNGHIVQHSALNKMIWSVEEIIALLRADMDLQAGDLIYTGTPAGVGSVTIGDELSGGIEGLERITIRIV